jgi:hypothetical protein
MQTVFAPILFSITSPSATSFLEYSDAMIPQGSSPAFPTVCDTLTVSVFTATFSVTIA